MGRDVSRLVQAFISADLDASELAPGLSMFQTEDPKEQATIHLFEASIGLRSATAVLEEAESVSRLRSSADLHLLFLLAWSRCLMYHGASREQVAAVARQAQRMLNAETPAELRAWIAFQLLWEDHSPGAREAAMRAMAAVSPDSPHHRRITQTRAMMFFSYGMGTMVAEDQLPRIGGVMSERLTIFRLVDAVQRGALDRAVELLPRAAACSRLAAAPCRREQEVARYLLGLMCERSAAHRAVSQELLGEDPRVWPDWVRSTGHLLGRRIGEALRFARAGASHPIDLGSFSHRWSDGNALVRAELAAGNGDAVLRLLTLRREDGHQHYFDDLFWWRAELLRGRRGAAEHHLAALMKSVERFAARGRLAFELELARELSSEELARANPTAGASTVVGPPPGEQPVASPTKPSPRSSEADGGRAATTVGELIYASAEMKRIVTLLRNIADHDVPVLISGETGTGKEVVAKTLHQLGERRARPFIAVNCAALSDSLIESELFGYHKGAFTGADRAYRGLFLEAEDGTLFLDEIGHISPRLQAALLRVLETREVRSVGSSRSRKILCRVVAATNADLRSLVERGEFRQDLLFRLQRLLIDLPPLRQRREDILLLAQHFLDTGRASGLEARLSADAESLLVGHGWPGNVRELRNVIERMRLVNSDKLHYTAEDLAAQGLAAGVVDGASRLTPQSQQEPQLGASAAPSLPPTHADDPFPPKAARAVAGDGRSKLSRIERLRALFEAYPKLKVCEVMAILGVSRSTASRYLAELVDEGVIVLVEPSRSVSTRYYRISS